MMRRLTPTLTIYLALLAIILFGNLAAYGFSRTSSSIISSRHRLQHQQQQPPFCAIKTRQPFSSSSDGWNRVVVFPSRGGGGDTSLASSSSNNSESSSPSSSIGVVLTSLWGTGGVIYILMKAIKRVVPIALEPFTETAVRPLSQLELGVYAVTCLWFGYVEGYKGFQKKFSPLVVKRSFTLMNKKSTTNTSLFNPLGLVHILFAPLYSMGLIHATKKRKTVSWCVTIGISVIVAIVKKLPYPYRNIIDGGVVVGLTYGSLSILGIYLKSLLTNTTPDIDPALPIKNME